MTRARSEVLVCGYSFDHGAETLGALHRAARERNVHATLFLNIERAPYGADAAAIDRHVTVALEQFLVDNVLPSTVRTDRTTEAGSSDENEHIG